MMVKKIKHKDKKLILIDHPFKSFNDNNGIGNTIKSNNTNNI